MDVEFLKGGLLKTRGHGGYRCDGCLMGCAVLANSPLNRWACQGGALWPAKIQI